MPSPHRFGRAQLSSATSALLGAALTVAACGGKAVLDGDQTPGEGGAGGAPTSASGGTAEGGSSVEPGVGGASQPPPDECSPEFRGLPCSSPRFPDCAPEVVDGVPCCSIEKRCIDGEVTWLAACFDSCAQSCELVTNPVHCEVMACGWVELTGTCVSLR